MKIKTIAENRKDVVNAICQITGEASKYMGPPTFGYRIGECTINREGDVEIQDEKLAEWILEGLVERGFAETEEIYDAMEIKVPMEKHTGTSLKNLVFLIKSKQYLLNKALGRKAFAVDEDFISRLLEEEIPDRNEFLKLLHECEGNKKNIGFYFTEDAIVFEGFPMSEEGMEMKAYIEMAGKMCAKALSSKRVNPKETIEENEKYYMRVWLLRLGFGGQDSKDTRKVMLQNLNGHSAFRTEEEIERAKIRNKQRAEARRHDE